MKKRLHPCGTNALIFFCPYNFHIDIFGASIFFPPFYYLFLTRRCVQKSEKKELKNDSIFAKEKKCNHWRASPSLHPCPTRRLDRKAPLVTMFTSCVCIRGNPERFAGSRGGFGCSSDAARHALDRGSSGTSLEKREFLRGISYLAPFCFPVAQIPS